MHSWSVKLSVRANLETALVLFVLREEKCMKKTVKQLPVLLAAGALVLVTALFASCDYWDEEWYKNGETGSTSTAETGSTSTADAVTASTASVQSVSPSTLANKTLKGVDGGSEVFSYVFSADGKTVTVTEADASMSGTCTYDGDKIQNTSTGAVRYLVSVNGNYRTAFGKQTKADGTSGFVGKWKHGWDTAGEHPTSFNADGSLSWDDGGTGTWTVKEDGETVHISVSGGSAGSIEEDWWYTGSALYSLTGAEITVQ